MPPCFPLLLAFLLQLSLVLDLSHLGWALDTAEADLLRKAGKASSAGRG